MALETLKNSSVEQLSKTIETYPYFSTAYMFLTKKYKEQEHVLFNTLLEQTAVRVYNRTQFHDFLYPQNAEKNIAIIEPEDKIESTPPAETSKEILSADALSLASIHEGKKDAKNEIISEVKQDFFQKSDFTSNQIPKQVQNDTEIKSSISSHPEFSSGSLISEKSSLEEKIVDETTHSETPLKPILPKEEAPKEDLLSFSVRDISTAPKEENITSTPIETTAEKAVETTIEQPAEIIQIEETPSEISSNSKEEIETPTIHIPEFSAEEPIKTEIPQAEKSAAAPPSENNAPKGLDNMSFYEWLQSLKTENTTPQTKPIEVSEPISTKNPEPKAIKSSEILAHDLDSFIDAQIQKKKRKQPIQTTSTLLFSTDELAKISVDEHNLVSENIAKLQLKQGKYLKAIETLEKLKLKNPEKSAFFAAQIEEIQHIIKNKS